MQKLHNIKLASQYMIIGVATLAMMALSILPAIASAAQVTSRSVALSSSSAGSANVTYEVNFTSVGAAGAFTVDFCENTPLIGQACDPATGFTAAGAATSTSGFSVDSATATRVIVEGAIGATSAVQVELTGITNPTNAGPLYARIVSYDTAANAALSSPTNRGTGAVDEGGVAISITPTIGVSGLVLETMTFCVSGQEILGATCSGTMQPTNIVLGDETAPSSGVFVLAPDKINEGSIYAQLSTNAANGAVVRLKSSAANCGGLMRAGAPTACDILPALDQNIIGTANLARFGVKTTAAYPTVAAANANGTLQPVPASFYDNNHLEYALNFDENNETGVTSTYGDPFLNTAGAPVNNQNMQLTFGATVSNDTPAGSYSADLSLIAVGTF